MAVERYCKENVRFAGRLIPVPTGDLSKLWPFLGGAAGRKGLRLNRWNVQSLQKRSRESGCWMSDIRKEWKTMKEYEVIWEIFNKCPRNQMRDVFVEEVEIADPEEYVKKKFQGKDVSYDKTILARWNDRL